VWLWRGRRAWRGSAVQSAAWALQAQGCSGWAACPKLHVRNGPQIFSTFSLPLYVCPLQLLSGGQNLTHVIRHNREVAGLAIPSSNLQAGPPSHATAIAAGIYYPLLSHVLPTTSSDWWAAPSPHKPYLTRARRKARLPARRTAGPACSVCYACCKHQQTSVHKQYSGWLEPLQQ